MSEKEELRKKMALLAGKISSGKKSVLANFAKCGNSNIAAVNRRGGSSSTSWRGGRGRGGAGAPGKVWSNPNAQPTVSGPKAGAGAKRKFESVDGKSHAPKLSFKKPASSSAALHSLAVSPTKREHSSNTSSSVSSLLYDGVSPPVSPKRKPPLQTAGAFGFDYDEQQVEEEEEVVAPPCTQWPDCRFKTNCKYSHPTAVELTRLHRRPDGPVQTEDIVPLITPFKNNTVALKTLHGLLMKRFQWISNIKHRGATKPRPIELDDVLKSMGLPNMRTILADFSEPENMANKHFKYTSKKEWSKQSGCYFAVMRLGQAFLVRYYKLSEKKQMLRGQGVLFDDEEEEEDMEWRKQVGLRTASGSDVPVTTASNAVSSSLYGDLMSTDLADDSSALWMEPAGGGASASAKVPQKVESSAASSSSGGLGTLTLTENVRFVTSKARGCVEYKGVQRGGGDPAQFPKPKPKRRNSVPIGDEWLDDMHPQYLTDIPVTMTSESKSTDPTSTTSTSKSSISQEEEDSSSSSSQVKPRPAQMREIKADAIQSSNKGYAVLLKLGWQLGEGLGRKNQGIVNPVGIKYSLDRGGLGSFSTQEPGSDSD